DYVPLHTSLHGNPSFRDLVTRVQLAIEHAATNGDIPRDQGGHEAIPPNPDGSAGFQVLFELDSSASSTFGIRELREEPPEVESGSQHFDLKLSLVIRGRTGRGSLSYNAELFDAPRIARMAGHLRTLLTGVAADPGLRLSAMPLLTSSEQRQLA